MVEIPLTPSDPTPKSLLDRMRPKINLFLGVILCSITLIEVNRPMMQPHAKLAIFAMLGILLCFLNKPLKLSVLPKKYTGLIDTLLILLTVLSCGYLILHTEKIFSFLWTDGKSLGDRAGQESSLEFWIGLAGMLVVFESARRSVGWTLPILSFLFLAYAFWGNQAPDWMFPHRGYPLERVVGQVFLHNHGIFGVALYVMFQYVFLFVIFGAFLSATGATNFIVNFSSRLFAGSPGGAAKVAVMSSGLMGSLSGSAVANVVTTGTFTIPFMRKAGFSPKFAAAVEAAASSGGALMPPVMGAGAYLMLELIPGITYLEVIRAAAIPGVLYYLSLLFIVHFQARKLAVQPVQDTASQAQNGRFGFPFEGIIFISSFIVLLGLMALGYSIFYAITCSLGTIVVLSWFNRRTQLDLKKLGEALRQSAVDLIPLVTAAACVGVIMGVVTLTGIGTKLPTAVAPLAENSLFLALIVIMITTIILGMGLPSAVCYLLVVTMMGSVLTHLGVTIVSAHFFIFYFGMMSMVTPPVALAAYAAASISGSGIMETGVSAFRIALVGFTLPFMFIYQPELLMLTPTGELATWFSIFCSVFTAVAGLFSYSIGLTGYYYTHLRWFTRIIYFGAAGFLLIPGPLVNVNGHDFGIFNAIGLTLLIIGTLLNRQRYRQLEAQKNDMHASLLAG